MKFLLMDSGILGFGIRNPTNDWNPESKFYQERIDHSLLVLLTKTWIQYLESGITYLIHCLFLAVVEFVSPRSSPLGTETDVFAGYGGVDNLPFSVSGLLSFSASWYRALLFPYLLTHLVTMHVFKIWLRRTLNGFLLSGCPGCHLGEENKKLYWTLWVAVSVVKIKALSENLASRNRLLSVDYYLFPY